MANTLINPLYPRPHFTAGTNAVSTGFMLNVTSTSTATSVILANLGSFNSAPAELVFFDVQGANVLCTFDGNTPALGSKGHILATGTNYTWQVGTLFQAKFTLATATTASLYISQFAM